MKFFDQCCLQISTDKYLEMYDIFFIVELCFKICNVIHCNMVVPTASFIHTYISAYNLIHFM